MSDNESVSSHGSEDSSKFDLRNPDVTTKYRLAGDIANAALKVVLDSCVRDKEIIELCTVGDEHINSSCSKVYNKRSKGEKLEKGVAFPTCVSVNEICGNFSPLEGESYKLKEGDIVKVNLGCHIDGYIAVAGHTTIIGKPTAKHAQVMKAAWTAAEAALRTLKIGKSNLDVTSIIEVACDQFNCRPIAGVRSHQIKRFVIEGNRYIASKNSTSPEDKTETFHFAPNEAYYLDILVSTGDGKTRQTESKTTVFKRAVETKYQLKTPLARTFLAEVNRRFPTLPFTVRSIGGRTHLVGVPECMRHELLHPFAVLAEKPGEIVAQIKFTVLLLPGGTKKITGLDMKLDDFECDMAVTNPDLVALLKTSANPKIRKKKQKDTEEAPDLVEG